MATLQSAFGALQHRPAQPLAVLRCAPFTPIGMTVTSRLLLSRLGLVALLLMGCGRTASAPPVTVTPSPSQTSLDRTPTVSAAGDPAELALRIEGARFVDGQGRTVQPRGVNYSGFEFAVMQGWSSADPSGAQAGQSGGPRWSALQSWNVNTLRLPLNEASWLGKPCTDTEGVEQDPDPANNYRAAVEGQVKQAIAAGLYVILDLHWSAPGRTCPLLQMQMANADNSLDFWRSVAETFKDQPAVLFELFNEPFTNFGFSGNAWTAVMHGVGGRFTSYPATSAGGVWKEIDTEWAVASYQAMLDTVRATGARNIVLVGSLQYAQDLSGWLIHRATDPLQQMAAVWHPYPTFGAAWGSPEHSQPNEAPQVFEHARDIIAAGIPLIATEVGDRNTPGTVGAPLVTTITDWADTHGVGVLGWGWNVWQEPDHVLIRDVDGSPTDGYGRTFRDWLLTH
jgi:endoglucanase